MDMFTLRLTSEVFHKVLQFHLALRLHVGTVHVGIEEDDGEGQDKDGVWVSELAHHYWVADTVPLAEREKNISEPLNNLCAVQFGCLHISSPESLDEALHLLRFPLDSDLCLEFP